MKLWQLPFLAFFTLASLRAQEEKSKFDWDPLNIRISLFTNDLVMLGSERDEYASNLAAFAANEITEKNASIASLNHARRILALAMHLSLRNKQALVTQFQLSKGLLPEKASGDYSPPVLARLLLTRGQLLEKQPAGENTVLAHYLIQLAAEIDPRNEDAVYASEIMRLDQGTPDWDKLTKPIEIEEMPAP